MVMKGKNLEKSKDIMGSVFKYGRLWHSVADNALIDENGKLIVEVVERLNQIPSLI